MGLHKPSTSDKFRELLSKEGEDIAAADSRLAAGLAHAIFPQLLVTPKCPPVLLIHGSKDTAVLTQSSRAMHTHLRNAQSRLDLGVRQMCVHRPRALSEDCGVFGAVDEQYEGALGGDEQLGEDGEGEARCEPGIGCCYIFTFL